MLDIGFSEIVVIGVVALIVIGPERMPKVARTLGHLFGRAQRYVNQVKADISREMNLEELQKFQDQIQDATQSLNRAVQGVAEKTESEIQAISHTIKNDDVVVDKQASLLEINPVIHEAPRPVEVSPQLELALPPAPLMVEKTP